MLYLPMFSVQEYTYGTSFIMTCPQHILTFSYSWSIRLLTLYWYVRSHIDTVVDQFGIPGVGIGFTGITKVTADYRVYTDGDAVKIK